QWQHGWLADHTAVVRVVLSQTLLRARLRMAMAGAGARGAVCIAGAWLSFIGAPLASQWMAVAAPAAGRGGWAGGVRYRMRLGGRSKQDNDGDAGCVQGRQTPPCTPPHDRALETLGDAQLGAGGAWVFGDLAFTGAQRFLG